MNLKSLFIALLLLTGCENSGVQNSPEEPSISEMVGQMLMVGFRGFELTETSHIHRDITEYNLGGVILFDYDVPRSSPDRNVNYPEQVKHLNNRLQELAGSSLFIAVDQEGGRVARLKPARGFPETVSAGYLGKVNNPDTTKKYSGQTAELLAELGFNINFAPVVDLDINPENPIIGRLERSFGADPELVNKHAELVIQQHLKKNVLPVLKHFPGHGSAWNDSHLGMADVTDTWTATELAPYRYLLQNYPNAAVMTAHVFNSELDPEHPATLSKHVPTDILRGTLAFNGVLFSDDMQMEAVRSFYGTEDAVKKAINAGVDVLVFANNSVYEPDIVPEIITAVTALVKNGDISEEQIRTSYNRIIQAKNNLGLK